MPQLPADFRRRYSQLGLPVADVLVLADELPTAHYFQAVLAAGAPAKPAANWVMGDIMAFCKVCLHTLAALLFMQHTLPMQLKIGLMSPTSSCLSLPLQTVIGCGFYQPAKHLPCRVAARVLGGHLRLLQSVLVLLCQPL